MLDLWKDIYEQLDALDCVIYGAAFMPSDTDKVGLPLSTCIIIHVRLGNGSTGTISSAYAA